MKDSPKKLPTKKPVPRPIRLCKTIQEIRLYDSWLIWLKFNEKIIPIIKAIKNSEILGKNFMTLSMGIKILKNRPKKTGKKTIKNNDLINGITSMFIFLLDNKKISIGVKNTETIVEKKVQTIDSATFPLHKYVIKLEAVPPGQQPKIIIPRASSEGILNAFTNTKAVTGIIVNWRKVTKKNKEGFLSIFLKSINSNVIPIKNITRPKKKGM